MSIGQVSQREKSERGETKVGESYQWKAVRKDTLAVSTTGSIMCKKHYNLLFREFRRLTEESFIKLSVPEEKIFLD